jgi:glyoxylase-like metal-dependent hydrolase (beta-lactamase superfamily II)
MHTDLHTHTLICAALTREGLQIEDVDLVVLTHAHPDHAANFNLFAAQRPLLFGVNELNGERVMQTVLAQVCARAQNVSWCVQRPFRQLTPNVEVWKTPGHTQHDLSVVVRNVPSYGSICAVGECTSVRARVHTRA